MRHAVIVTAAGSSRRFNTQSSKDVKKEFLTVDGESVLCRSIRPFLQTEGLCALVVTYRKGDFQTTKDLVSTLDTAGVKVILAEGGSTRQQSVFNGLKALYELRDDLDISVVSIHDGARPYLDSALVKACIEEAERTGGACPCLPVTDTIIRIGGDGMMEKALDRESLRTVQTPQAFRFPDIYLAHLDAQGQAQFTDDTQIFIRWGGKVACVPGNAENRKITFAGDIVQRREK